MCIGSRGARSVMNKHYLIDTVAISVGAFFYPKYFRNKVKSKSLTEHFNEIALDMPKIEFTTNADKQEYDVNVSSFIGSLNAGFCLQQWLGLEYPTIIYHHGASEIPYDYGFKNIFPVHKKGSAAIKANLFSVRAVFHDNRKNFMQGMAKTENWLVMMAVSVKVIEQIIAQVRQQEQHQQKSKAHEDKQGIITVSGTSLGGFITNLHHIYYNSADRYKPLLAGTAMHEAFLNSVYSRSVDKAALRDVETMTELFDFQKEFAKNDKGNVFPLLAKHDAIVQYKVQGDSYAGLEIATIDKGHVTGALSYNLLRQHILKI